MARQKKVKITLKIDRPNLAEDFSTWLKTKTAYDYDTYGCCDDMYSGYWWGSEWDLGDDDYPDDGYTPWWATADDDDDRYETYWSKLGDRKKNKRGKRGNKHSKNKSYYEDDVFDNQDDDYKPRISNEELDDILAEKKEIYFYDDIEDPESVHKFNNLRKFYLFLDEQGIDISDAEGSKFIRETVRHCCIDPLKKEVRHVLEIISDHSHGALLYEISEDSALFSD